MTVGDKRESFKRFFAFGLTKAIVGNTPGINCEGNTHILIQNWFDELKRKLLKSGMK